MPSIDNITTTGGLTFDIEPIDLWTVERDWSNFFYAFSYRVVYKRLCANERNRYLE